MSGVKFVSIIRWFHSAGSFVNPLIRHWFNFPAAVLLLVAAALKLHQLSTTPVTDNLLFESRLANFLIANGELLVGLWLLSMWQSLNARLFAIGLFCVFILFSVYKLLNGETDCSCFGVYVVHPWITLMIDLSVVGFLAFWKPNSQAKLWPGWIGIAAIFILLSTGHFLAFEPVSVAEVDRSPEANQTIVVDADSLLVSDLERSLFPYIAKGGEQLKMGLWRIILYHEDCPKCQSLIQENQDPPIPTAFVEVPPFGGVKRESSGKVKWLKLTDQQNWFVSAPIDLIVEDGVVLSK